LILRSRKRATKAQLKHIRELLRDKSARDKNSLFVVEGLKILSDTLKKGIVPESVLISTNMSDKVDMLEFLPPIIFDVSEREYESLSDLRTPEGVLAVFDKNKLPLYPGPNDITTGVSVLCDGIQDPGNLGTIIRSSAAFGVNCLMSIGDAVDRTNPKVVRASSGAIFDIPVEGISIEDLLEIKNSGCRIFVSEVEGKGTIAINAVRKDPGCLLVFGAEGKGVSEKIRGLADEMFNIPITDAVESLNVSSAVAIALYEIQGVGK
jgi:RNA methyltransferase, TrmH family